MAYKQKPSVDLLDIDDIEYLICHIAMVWRRLVYTKIKSLKISGTEKRVLFCVARFPGSTQIQVAHLLELEPQNLMRSLDRLEKRGWIAKTADKTDRRAKCLFITEEAKIIIKKIKLISDRLKPEILAGLSPQEVANMVKKLSNIRQNLLSQLEDVGTE